MIIMTMTKAIKSGKEHRKEYYGAKAICRSCRNHGSCVICYGNRTYKNRKRLEKMLDLMNDMQYNKITIKKRNDYYERTIIRQNDQNLWF